MLYFFVFYFLYLYFPSAAFTGANSVFYDAAGKNRFLVLTVERFVYSGLFSLACMCSYRIRGKVYFHVAESCEII